MSRQFELLVFDWDGTLMDSTSAISESLIAACKDLRLTVPSEENARFVIGLGLKETLEYLLPELPKADYPALLERYREHFLIRDKGTTLFPGAKTLLARLRAEGFKLAVATGKSRQGLHRVLTKFELEGVFHATRCADESLSKPDPQMLLWLMEQLQVPKEKTLMIGDTSHDMLMAKAAEVPRLAVSYGAHSQDKLLAHEPLACMGHFSELDRWLMTQA